MFGTGFIIFYYLDHLIDVYMNLRKWFFFAFFMKIIKSK